MRRSLFPVLILLAFYSAALAVAAVAAVPDMNISTFENYTQTEDFDCSLVALDSTLEFVDNQVRFTIRNSYYLPLTLHRVNLDWDTLQLYPDMGVGVMQLASSLIWNTVTPDQSPATVIGAPPSEAPFNAGAPLTIQQANVGGAIPSATTLSVTIFNGPHPLFPRLQAHNFDGTVITVIFNGTECDLPFNANPLNCTPGALSISAVDFSSGNGVATFDITNLTDTNVNLVGFSLNWLRYGSMELWRVRGGGGSLGASLPIWENAAAAGDIVPPTIGGVTPDTEEGTWLNNLSADANSSTRIYVQFLGAGTPPLPIAVPGVQASDFNDSTFYFDIPGCNQVGVAVPVNDALIDNGAFTSGLSSWLIYGDIEYELVNGVFRFRRPLGGVGTVVFQESGVALSAPNGLRGSFQLGNASPQRQRVGVLLHDADFSDTTFCAFWLPANTPLATYGVEFMTQQPWADVTLSFYASTAVDSGWIEIDNVQFTANVSVPAAQTRCIDALAPSLP
ncbi:MAG: hypothetical protein SGI73_15520 [Chloroflexota bacterium]|nr:hypothetical protein [Chloroflexota bacterium]